GEPAQRRVAVLFNDVTERRKADDALQAARQSLEVALDAARLGAWDADLVAGTARTSPRHDEIMGDAAPVSRWNPQAFRARLLPDDRPVFDAALARAMDAVAQGEMETEVRVRWSGGGARWVRLVGRVYRDDGGRPARMAGVSLDVTAQKEADAALERAHAWLEQRVAERTAELAIANEVLATQIAEREALERARDQLLRQLARAEEQERLRLSRELHDQMGQLVAALLLGLRSLEVGPGPAPGALGELERLAEQIAREVHTVALELRPPALDRLGLRRALEGRLGEWAERHRLEADFQAVGIGDERFQPEIETALFRAVQEGLTNVARHARATGVSLVLERRPGSIAVILEDDGRGFDVEAASGAAAEGGEGGRLGLLGMQERVRLLGGTLDIESTPGAGTTLYVRLPDRAVAGPGAGVEA
ncbi:MAG TPA: ATP-binding protein, partial [Longimicrobium sp.]|nr:ATP-binding protein [Longimicrobium sp.]